MSLLPAYGNRCLIPARIAVPVATRHAVPMNAEHWDLCATPALARQLRMRHAVAQRAAGHRAWAAPRVADLDSWISQSWAATWPDERLLSAAQHLALWQKIVEDDPETEALISRRGLARQARTAAHWVARYDIDIANAPTWTPEHAAFQRWHAQAQSVLQREHWLTSAQLPGALLARLDDLGAPRPASITLYGFVQPPDPAQQAVLDALAARGTQIEFAPQPAAAEALAAHRCADARAQWAWLGDAVAAKLRAAAAADSEAPDIVIACADPAAQAALIDSEFAPRVAPWRHDLRSGHTAKPWRVEPAPAFGEHSLVAAARAIVTVETWRNDFNTVSRVLLCGALWQGADRFAAAELEATLRSRAQPLTHLADCVRWAPEALGQRMLAWEAAVRERPRRATPSAWASHWLACLTAIGWPGAQARGSAGFQAARLLRETLTSMAGLDPQLGEIGHGAALGWLDELLAGRPWAPRVEHVQPITITTHDEAAALPADVRIVLDVDDATWPQPPLRQGLIASGVLRDAGVPGASPVAAAKAAEQTASALLCGAQSAHLLLCSVDASGSVCAPAPVWPDGLDWAQTAPAEPAAATAPLDAVEEQPAPPITDASREGVRGGTRIFSTYARSPLLAFAAHRLGVSSLESVRSGLSPMEQGIVVHAVLEQYWAQCSSSEAHASRSDTALRDQVAALLEAALDDAIDAHRYPRALLRSEQARLHDVLLRWLRHERHRQAPFTVAAQEAKVTFTFERLPLDVRLDRIDLVDVDGAQKVLVVDYKTGAGRKPAAWFDAAISEPQLPLYATPEAMAAAGYTRIDGLAFANVHPRSPQLLAATNWARRLSDADAIGLKQPEAFDDALADTHTRLREAAAGFVAGELGVDAKAAEGHDLAVLIRLEDQ